MTEITNSFADQESIPEVVLEALLLTLRGEYYDETEQSGIDIDGVMDLAMEVTERIAELLNTSSNPFGVVN